MTYANQQAAQRSIDAMCDCCGHDETQHDRRQYVDNETRRALRKMKGRPAFRSTYRQWDSTTQRLLPETVAPDPIYSLNVARSAARNSPALALRYGEIRQTVVSPVHLPDMRAIACEVSL